MNKLKVLELFGGIGACSKALERLKVNYEIVDYVEIDKYAVKSFNAIHNTNFEPQDICEWDKDIEVDLIMHGSPCQDFSLAGKQAGGDKDSGTRSSLMYETIRIVEKLKPKYIIWENVKNLLSKKHIHNFNGYLETMEQLGYTNYYQVLNAKNYGIPQNRERVFTISIRKDIDKGYTFPEPQELKLKLKDMLEDEVDEKYYLSDKMINYCLGTNQKESKFPRGERFLQNINRSNQDVAVTISANPGNRPVDNFIKVKDGNITQKPYLKIKEATKQGYKEAYEGDGINISGRMKYQRGNVQKESIQTLTTSGGNERGVVVEIKIGLFDHTSSDNFAKGKRDYGYRENYGTLKCTPKYSIYKSTDLRIRKLTPCECWALMGFDKTDFEKATEVNSNTQLYKQAGNSIVVNVLEAILKELLINE